LNSRLRARFRLGPPRAFTIVELIVAVAVGAIVLVILSKFFMDYYLTFQETQARLGMQRDMRTIQYWVRKDLTALVKGNNNFDLANSGDSQDFCFLAADDPTDTVDYATNATDSGLDRFTYTVFGNKVTRIWNPMGTMASVSNVFAMASIDASRGDTIAFNITLRAGADTEVKRSDFNATLGDFDYKEPIRRVDMEIVFSKRPIGLWFATRPAILERAEIKSVALYRKTG
jgi:prepilin-type N-terminal cleavage/methylation domain-containing protein